MMEEKIKEIAKIFVGVKYYEWQKIEHAINKKYSSAIGKVELTDAKEMERAISIEFVK